MVLYYDIPSLQHSCMTHVNEGSQFYLPSTHLSTHQCQMVLVAMFVIQATVKIYVYNVCGAVSMLEKFLDPYWD